MAYYLDDLHGHVSEWHKDPPRSISYARYSCPSKFTTLIPDFRVSCILFPDLTSGVKLQLTNATPNANANATFFISCYFM